MLPAHSVLELPHNNREAHLNINGISDLLPEDNSDIVRRLRDFGCLCAMVGYEFLDHDAIGESYIGISVAEATDYTKSESDLVLISLPCYLFHQLCKSVGRSVRL